jgi:pSer/pThr/pTyr-binding forkhead associated (FHA) protein
VASIILISGTRRGDFYRLGQRINIIGRDEALPIQIIDDCVSRKHMSICFDKRNWSYSAVDINSKNGVAVYGVMIGEILKDPKRYP